MSIGQKICSDPAGMKSKPTEAKEEKSTRKHERILMFSFDSMEIKRFLFVCLVRNSKTSSVSALNRWQNMIYDTLNPEYY